MKERWTLRGESGKVYRSFSVIMYLKITVKDTITNKY